MFADYESLVLGDYNQKKITNAISMRLVHPTPAKIKRECIAVCSERFNRKDDKLFRTFFGQSGDLKSCVQAIGRCETDKFKPLANFLKNQTSNTEEKNIELLAWLIDFQPRPFEFGRKYGLSSPEKPEIGKEELPESDTKKEENLREDGSYGKKKDDVNLIRSFFLANNNPKLKVQGVAILLVILMFIVASTYWLKRRNAFGTALTGREKCMYWTGDHYQPVSCNQKLGDTLVVAFDSVKINYFKRITMPDTITNNAIGKVWYIKLNGNLEFYTSGGNHPIYPQFRLRPITGYMIKKHLQVGQSQKNFPE